MRLVLRVVNWWGSLQAFALLINQHIAPLYLFNDAVLIFRRDSVGVQPALDLFALQVLQEPVLSLTGDEVAVENLLAGRTEDLYACLLSLAGCCEADEVTKDSDGDLWRLSQSEHRVKRQYYQ